MEVINFKSGYYADGMIMPPGASHALGFVVCAGNLQLAV